MTKIAFLGMGSMGSRMAINLINAGHEVCVWNREPQRTLALQEAGASVATTPREAAANAEFVIAMLRDDQASEQVWCDADNGALAGMSTETIAIDCSTLTVKWVRTLYNLCENKNIAFLDAPVAGSRPQAEAMQLIFFVGGSKATFEQAQPVLTSMGSAVHHAGSTGCGAAIKLAVNALFGIQLATLAELLALLKATGLDVKHAVHIISATSVCSPAAKIAAVAMLMKNFSPQFPNHLMEKDLAYAVDTAVKNDQVLPLTDAARGIFQKAIENNFGGDNITRVAQLYD
jgi:3-hydroxyisobutyrate dehydrogenase-like beta-hydroxyacid dehydrogenase